MALKWVLQMIVHNLRESCCLGAEESKWYQILSWSYSLSIGTLSISFSGIILCVTPIIRFENIEIWQCHKQSFNQDDSEWVKRFPFLNFLAIVSSNQHCLMRKKSQNEALILPSLLTLLSTELSKIEVEHCSQSVAELWP